MASNVIEMKEVAVPDGVRSNDSRLPPMPLLGFSNYWYPAIFARKLKNKPVGLRLLGEDLVFVRYNAKPYALQDACPHRGAPLRLGFSIKPGLLACRFHGSVF